jgi:putative hydrolase of the HAD superfamily
MIEFIAFDADNTLWKTPSHLQEAHLRFETIVNKYAPYEYNLNYLDSPNREYGPGIRSFGLSMLEEALGLTHGRISSEDMQAVLDITKELLGTPVQLMPEAAAVLDELSGDYPLILIAKGDPFEQVSRLRSSGLEEYFRHIEIMQKTPANYSRLLRRHKIRAEEFLMVGNRLRSDILPVLSIGGQAVYIPQSAEPKPLDLPCFIELSSIAQLPEWLENKLVAA